MKKARTVMIWLLFAFTIFFPAGTLITACFGYSFELMSVSAYAVILAVLSLCTTVAFTSPIDNKSERILFGIIAPLSLINTAFIIFKDSRIWVIISLIVYAGYCCFSAIKHAKPLKLKITVSVLSALPALPIGLLGCLCMIFGDIGRNTVVKTVDSPDGKYSAQVIDSDQGALGGDTIVDVYKKGGIDAVLFKIEKKPQTVYCGDWGEFDNMQIHWKNDKCLVINSVEYEIE